MREQQAKDFWSVYLKLILRKGQETTIVNPFEEFRDSVAKGGYESVSDEEYANIYDQVEELSVFWQQRPKDSVAHIVIEALSRTHLYEDEIQDIAGILAEASERTNYTQQMLQEWEQRKPKRGWQIEKKQNFRRCRRIIRKKNGSKRNTVSKVSTKKHHSMTQTTAGHQS